MHLLSFLNILSQVQILGIFFLRSLTLSQFFLVSNLIFIIKIVFVLFQVLNH